MVDWVRLGYCPNCALYRRKDMAHVTKKGKLRCHDCHKALRLKPRNSGNPERRDARSSQFKRY